MVAFLKHFPTNLHVLSKESAVEQQSLRKLGLIFRAQGARGKCTYKFGSHYPEEIGKGGEEGKKGNVKDKMCLFPSPS